MTYTATMNDVMPAVATRYAGFWRRLLALIIDSILLMTVAALLSVVLPIFEKNSIVLENGNAIATFGYTWFGLAFSTILHWIYGATLESSPWQATIGKMALSIRVTDRNGGRLTFVQALVRNVAKLISNLTLYIGYIMAAFTTRKQALHDIMTGCLVVKHED